MSTEVGGFPFLEAATLNELLKAKQTEIYYAFQCFVKCVED
jgi:hypothetical protein